MASSSSEPAPDPSLNMQHAGQKLWLMKVPNFLLDNWTEREHGSSHVELGRVEEKVGPDGKKNKGPPPKLPKGPKGKPHPGLFGE